MVGYMLKKNLADNIRYKYKNSYFAKEMDLSNTYISLIVHRKQLVPKRVALAFTKTLNPKANIEDYFDYK